MDARISYIILQNIKIIKMEMVAKDGHSPFNRDPLHSIIHSSLTPNLL